MITQDECVLFADERQVTDAVRSSMADDGVTILPYAEFLANLAMKRQDDAARGGVIDANGQPKMEVLKMISLFYFGSAGC